MRWERRPTFLVSQPCHVISDEMTQLVYLLSTIYNKLMTSMVLEINQGILLLRNMQWILQEPAHYSVLSASR